MATFPLALTDLLGQYGAYLIYLVIGFAFGFVLEMAGFGNSKKLAAQFYFKEQTVLKVMFTAIVVAMVLIFLASGVGLLDYNLVYVNPTYLWPGIVGGLIMGVGFIIGGFCPGTSIVSAVTGKIDGVFFVLGVLFGIFMFGETVSLFEGFWNSSYMGRFTLPELFNVQTGVVVLGVVLMALFMFWGAEQLERIVGGMDLAKAPKVRYVGAGGLVLIAAAVIVVGQPTNADRWNRISSETEQKIAERAVQIHPGEVLSLVEDDAIKVVLLDVRSEADFNLFHLVDARHTPLEALDETVPELLLEPYNTVFVVMSNGEAAATDAYRYLSAEAVPNVYILEGGVNNWLTLFAHDGVYPAAANTTDELQFTFDAALGDRHPAAATVQHVELIFTPKVELEIKRGPSTGGCG